MSAEPPITEPPSWAEVLDLLRSIDGGDLAEVRIELPGFSLHVSRHATIPEPPPARAPAHAPADASCTPSTVQPTPLGAGKIGDGGVVVVTAPVLGVFYRRPAPDQPPFVEVGDRVEPGDTVATLEVMKLFSTVEAGVAGTVVDIVAADGATVEFGDPLVTIRPDPP